MARKRYSDEDVLKLLRELELDKLILKESLTYLKPRA